MKDSMARSDTTVGQVHRDVLAFTVGEDPRLDEALIEADCIGTAAHVTMLAAMPEPGLLSAADAGQVINQLIDIICLARHGRFNITVEDQDVHLAVERVLTKKLGDLGKKVHTGRSRNDQVAVDLRLYAKNELLDVLEEATTLTKVLLKEARRYVRTPMVGRTHMQPAMPSSVALWGSAHAESLLDDLVLVTTAYELNDRCPLGSAASYGVPLAIDPVLTARLLGFSGPHQNVLYANNARGKIESVILQALSQIMLSLSRLAQDLLLYSLPEFGYFTFPESFCTGSSIMPQKRNPDVLELVRARAASVHGCAQVVAEITRTLPSGYNRDLQETKGPFLQGIALTRSSLRVMALMMAHMKVNRKALVAGFTPEVFATDKALDLVGQGMPFRDAYNHVKEHLSELTVDMDPVEAVLRKKYPGAPGGLDLTAMSAQASRTSQYVYSRRRRYYAAVSRLLGVKYPDGL